MDYDLVIVGAGAAGIGAVRTAVRRGARTLVLQDGPVGGECTFTGCVPSKALLAAAARGASFEEAMACVRRAVEAVAAEEDAEALRRQGVDVWQGRARFVSPAEVVVDGRRVRGRRFVLATGSRPVLPRVEGLEERQILTNESVFQLSALPRSLVVLGGGPTGCEFAQAFARLGARVTLVELADRLLPGEEPEVSAVLARVFRREGVDLRLGQTVVGAQLSQSGEWQLGLSAGERVAAAAVLACVGRVGCTADLGLEVAGVAADERGYVRTDAALRTTAPRIWAAGDVTGRALLTHAAFEMGMVAAGNALGKRQRKLDLSVLPQVTFTDPEVGRVGATQAVAPHGRMVFLPLSAVDRAVVEGRTDGFVKLLAGPRRLVGRLGGGKILGVTVVAPRAGELVHEVALAMRTRMFAGRLAQTVHAYPTWSVALRQAVARLFES